MVMYVVTLPKQTRTTVAVIGYQYITFNSLQNCHQLSELYLAGPSVNGTEFTAIYCRVIYSF